MWTVSILPDPLDEFITRTSHRINKGRTNNDTNVEQQSALQFTLLDTKIVHAKCSLQSLLSSSLLNNNDNLWSIVQEGGRVAQVALADFLARQLAEQYWHHDNTVVDDDECSFVLEPLDCTTTSHRYINAHHHHSKKKKSKHHRSTFTPYILERNDIACVKGQLHIYLR
jgi:hypothetical protein